MGSKIIEIGRGTWSVQTEAANRVAAVRGSGFILEVTAGPITTDTEARVAAFQARDLKGAAFGSRLSALVAGKALMGSTSLRIIEGTLENWGQPVLRPLGRRKAFRLGVDGLTVLDWTSDCGKEARATLLDRWDAQGSILPPTRRLQATDLETATVERPVAVLYTHPGFGTGRVPGCVWLVEGYDANTDVVDGYLWIPGGGELQAEHGSIFGRQLFGWAALIEAAPAPVDPWKLGGTYSEAWGELFPAAASVLPSAVAAIA